ncbi:Hypothetical protein DEACI_4245 [Acididesulfobacillus acetoxydans]|uniref:Uncharacterized protein n=1 Tax=Acididesulfobacillus acetoxydans TaxID=1561005 RepID=A0A8S0WIK4_9FIRM|nr:Hypothetical protein DEACI_4245 [Acididesulfobacillus acetoxydans]CEJ07163.1 Hypothetical protein DEACI_1621 [Acididesulfobacillus acetoxydans]
MDRTDSKSMLPGATPGLPAIKSGDYYEMIYSTVSSLGSGGNDGQRNQTE